MTDNQNPIRQMIRNYLVVAEKRKVDYLLLPFHIEPDRIYLIVRDSDREFLDLTKEFDSISDLLTYSLWRHYISDEVEDALKSVLATNNSNPSLFTAPLRITKRRCYRGRLGRLENATGGRFSTIGDQWILHNYTIGSVQGTIVEMDIDEESPVDLVGMFPHIVRVVKHWVTKKQTDPFKIAAKLEKLGYKLDG